MNRQIIVTGGLAFPLVMGCAVGGGLMGGAFGATVPNILEKFEKRKQRKAAE